MRTVTGSYEPRFDVILINKHMIAHTYHINSISINSDGETYLSGDDLRINLWNLDISEQSFSMPNHGHIIVGHTSHFFLLLLDIVDIKPANMEELTEVITAAEFHPSHCNLFMYSSSKGTIKLSDMRASALCDQHSKGDLKVYLRFLFVCLP